MNRRSPGLSLSKAVTGFLYYKTAEGLSPTILDSYRRILDKWLAYVGDIEVDQGAPSGQSHLYSNLAPSCHSEERSDEESSSRGKIEILRSLRSLRMTNRKGTRINAIALGAPSRARSRGRRGEGWCGRSELPRDWGICLLTNWLYNSHHLPLYHYPQNCDSQRLGG